MYFIQETDKLNFFSKIFGVPKLEENKILIPQELKKEEIKRNVKTQLKLAKNIKNILEKSHCKKIILSKKVKDRKELKNQLYTYGFDIINGRWLFNVLSSKVIDYVVEKNDMVKEKTKISILVNDLTEINLENIKQITQTFKRINIVTNHIEKFKKIEEQILQEYGVMITVNNNKKKSLVNSDIILNYDFPDELINKYKIAEKAIIINIRGNIKIKQKRFEGKNYNDYEITYKSEEIFEEDINNEYSSKEIYEAYIYKQQPMENILKKVKKDNVKIKELLIYT